PITLVARPGKNIHSSFSTDPEIRSRQFESEASARHEVKLPQMSRSIPPFEEIVAVDWWGNPWGGAHWPTGIFKRYPVAKYDSQDHAVAATQALTCVVGELARLTWAKHHWKDDDSWFAELNPQFATVAEETLSKGELVFLKTQLQHWTEETVEV